MKIKLETNINNEYKEISLLGNDYGIVTKSEYFKELVGGFIFRPSPSSDIVSIIPINGSDMYYYNESDASDLRFRNLKPGEEITITIKN